MIQQKLRPASRSLSLHRAGSPTAHELREDNRQELWTKYHIFQEKRDASTYLIFRHAGILR